MWCGVVFGVVWSVVQFWRHALFVPVVARYLTLLLDVQISAKRTREAITDFHAAHTLLEQDGPPVSPSPSPSPSSMSTRFTTNQNRSKSKSNINTNANVPLSSPSLSGGLKSGSRLQDATVKAEQKRRAATATQAQQSQSEPATTTAGAIVFKHRAFFEGFGTNLGGAAGGCTNAVNYVRHLTASDGAMGGLLEIVKELTDLYLRYVGGKNRLVCVGGW